MWARTISDYWMTSSTLDSSRKELQGRFGDLFHSFTLCCQTTDESAFEEAEHLCFGLKGICWTSGGVYVCSQAKLWRENPHSGISLTRNIPVILLTCTPKYHETPIWRILSVQFIYVLKLPDNFFSLKILQTTMHLSFLRSIARHILYSTMISR